MELMEELYKDYNIKAECSSLKEYMENYYERNEPLFIEILHGFHICLQTVDMHYWKDVALHVYKVR